MIICSCHALSDHDVHKAMAQSSDDGLSAERLHGCFGCQLKCGRCVSSIQRILDGELANQNARGWCEKRLPQLCVQADVLVDSSHESSEYMSFGRSNMLGIA